MPKGGKTNPFEIGNFLWGLVVQQNSVLVMSVQLAYECDGSWHCIEPNRDVIRDGKTRKSSWDIDQDHLFQTEEEAIAAAKKIKVSGGKKGGKG